MFKYDVSIIVPIDNNEKYLGRAIKSVLNQSYTLKKIQLILINDGSTDKSLEICNKYSKKNKNILVINQENKGVLETRNTGIKLSQGKYIMFLEPNDIISKETVKSLINFFDEYYNDIDLATYPMFNINSNSSKMSYKYNLFKDKEGIFDLEKNPYIIQKTTNIIIKNSNNKEYFKNNINSTPIEEFNLRILMKKKKIGFCLGARYLYGEESIQQEINTMNPKELYSFDNMICYYNEIFNKYKEVNGGIIPKYLQVLFVETLNLKIKEDQLYPYFKEDNEFRESINKLAELLQNIDVDIIGNMPGMNKYHKFFIMKLGGKKISVNVKEKFEVYAENFLLERDNKIIMSTNKLTCKNNKLQMLGYVRAVILLEKEAELFCKTIDNQNNVNEIQVPLFKSSFERYGTKMKISKNYGFDIEIDISNVKSIYFYFKIGDYKYQPNYEFVNFSKINNEVIRFTHNRKLIKYNKKENNFKIKEIRLKNVIAIELKNNLKLFKNKEYSVVLYRLLSRIYYKKSIWLYCDRDSVFDNAYYQFMYDIKQKDNINKYYVYDNKFYDIKKMFKGVKRSQLVKYNSLKHKILYIASKKILTSFQAISYYSPLVLTLKKYVDILNYDLIYLQHGILHCHTPWIYANERNNIEKVVVSSYYEIDNFKNNYNYFEKNLLKAGMPRLDMLNSNSKTANKILFAPTWRRLLIGLLDENNRRILKEKEFLESEYYKKINELLNSTKLTEMLEKNNYIFEFKIHPVFKDYINLFKTTSKNIIINADTINLEDYKLFITDYSSYVFDYIYLKRPVLYFLPDELDFKAGIHVYRELDLPLEDGFGPITNTITELINNIEILMKNNFKMKEKYLEKMNNFFISNRNNHRSEIYKQLINE